MTAAQLKIKFLEYFKTKKHAIIDSASLIPENDPTVLFTTAGMHPLIPYLLGEKHPSGTRLANVQKCLRTGDIESIGDNWHLTFFEMLGNWSLGDYFKEDAIYFSLDFLTNQQWLGIDTSKLAVSVFAGDKDAPFDKAAYNAWLALGFDKKKIFKYGKDENWWGPAGQTGPCGPDTEIYYDTGKENCKQCRKLGPACGCGKYAEIWNNVFMEYNKTAPNKYEPLQQKNVDTGMGVERTSAILQQKDNVYDTELFSPLIEIIEEISQKKYRSTPIKTSRMRIIADHVKAAAFILADDRAVVPSNLEKGYVLRRLIRRAVRYGMSLGIEENFTFKLADKIINMYQQDYQELSRNKKFITDELIGEENKFKQTLAKGIREFDKRNAFNLAKDGKAAFYFFQTYGFPIEMYFEELRNKNIPVDKNKIKDEFEAEFKIHQELSKSGSDQAFKSGLADHKAETAKLHTAAHLMLAALRQVLGDHVLQRGSNITAERLRFDFSHGEKLTEQQLKQVEDLVNQQIKADKEVVCSEMSVDQAKNQGAMGIFDNKYGDQVRVFTVEGFSKEICSGPHAKRTSELGHFKIIKEQSVAAGIRRIKAVLE